jgi:CRISPR/Cas system CMR-associated protein Cmr5 small subunit
MDNHSSHLVDHYKYLSSASKKVKELHEGTKAKFGLVDTEIAKVHNLHGLDRSETAAALDKIVHDLKAKVKDIEEKFSHVNDFPTLVAREVEKHHTAFSLVGSEVLRVNNVVEHEKAELQAVKNVVEHVVQAIEQWEQRDATFVPRGPVAGAADHSQTVDAPQWEQRDATFVPRGPVAGAADHSQAVGAPSVAAGAHPSAPPVSSWDPWRASAAATAGAMPAQAPALQAPPGIVTQSPSVVHGTAKFSDPKVATLPSYQYDGKVGGVSWHRRVKDFIISRSSEIEAVFNSVEASEDSQALLLDLRARSSLRGVVPSVLEHLSSELWGFLVLCLTGDARCAIDTTDRREGFEVWRKLLKGIRS